MNKRYWWILSVYLIIQITSSLGVFCVMVMKQFRPVSDQQANLIISNWSIGIFIIGAFIVLLLLRNAPSTTYIDRQPKMAWTKSIWFIIGGVFVAFITQAITSTITAIINGGLEQSENTANLMGVLFENPLFIVLIVFVAPFLEEIIFRKVIFGALTNKMPVASAALVSAVIFAVIHFDFSYLLVYTGMGLVFAYFYYKTKRIYVSYAIHMLMNAVVALAGSLQN